MHPTLANQIGSQNAVVFKTKSKISSFTVNSVSIDLALASTSVFAFKSRTP